MIWNLLHSENIKNEKDGCYMPAKINGPVTIDNITVDGDVQFGDLLFITPKTVSKAQGGSGGFNTGGGIITNTGASVTNDIDSGVIDEPINSNH